LIGVHGGFAPDRKHVVAESVDAARAGIRGIEEPGIAPYEELVGVDSFGGLEPELPAVAGVEGEHGHAFVPVDEVAAQLGGGGGPGGVEAEDDGAARLGVDRIGGRRGARSGGLPARVPGDRLRHGQRESTPRGRGNDRGRGERD